MPTHASPASDGRYRQLEELLELAIELQGSFSGLSYAQIAERWKCSDKTAKRRVKALRNVFGEALRSHHTPESSTLRFRLRHRLVVEAVAFSDAELSALGWAVEAAWRAACGEEAAALARVMVKVRALMLGSGRVTPIE